MQQQVFHQAQPIGQPVGHTDPGVAFGLLIAFMLALLIVRYLKVILIFLAMALMVLLILGVTMVEPLIVEALHDLAGGG
jgi:hypothetical protein